MTYTGLFIIDLIYSSNIIKHFTHNSCSIISSSAPAILLCTSHFSNFSHKLCSGRYLATISLWDFFFFFFNSSFFFLYHVFSPFTKINLTHFCCCELPEMVRKDHTVFMCVAGEKFPPLKQRADNKT